VSVGPNSLCLLKVLVQNNMKYCVLCTCTQRVWGLPQLHLVLLLLLPGLHCQFTNSTQSWHNQVHSCCFCICCQCCTAGQAVLGRAQHTRTAMHVLRYLLLLLSLMLPLLLFRCC